jgi:hypothetical protein
MKIRFLYHAEAAAATGQLTLPHQELIEVAASASVPINGGHGRATAEKFNHRDIISFDRAHVHVVGSYSEKDGAHGSLASATIEGVNILNMVTCDRIVLRLTSKHPEDGAEASFIPLGSRFENLRIAGHRIDVDLATDLFTHHSTWSKLTQAYQHDEHFRREISHLSMIPAHGSNLPASKGILGVTLARGLDKLPGGLIKVDHGIYVPHFGTVYLGEYFRSERSHRLLMLHVDLGCAVEGCGGIGSGQTNGEGYP